MNNPATHQSDDSSSLLPNSASRTVEELRALMAPGVLKALRGVSSDSFEVLQRRISAEAMTDGQLAPHYIACLAQLVREFDGDPRILKLEPLKIDERLSYSEKKSLKTRATPWNQFHNILEKQGNRAASKEDWMTFFEALAKTIQGQEREHGMDLVNCAFRRPDCCIEAIEKFPKIFRSARGRSTEHTSLLQLANGMGSQEHLHAALQMTPSGSAESGEATRICATNMAAVVTALQSTKVKVHGDALVRAALCADSFIVDAFFESFGKEAMLSAKEGQGFTALHKAATMQGYEASVSNLIALGSDLFTTDANHRTPLESATRINGNFTTVATLLRAKAYTPKILDDLASKATGTYMPDREVRALILSEKALVAIEAMDIASLRLDAARA